MGYADGLTRRELRDARLQNLLIAELRALSEEQALPRVLELINADPCSGIDIASSVLTERSSFERLLRDALATSDASGIRYWMEMTVGRLGSRRLLRMVREALPSKTGAVHGALYWLPSILRAPSEREAIRRLLEEFQEMHVPNSETMDR